MCGFIGFSVNNADNIDLLNKKFSRFLDEMNHRGPDFSDEINYKKVDRFSRFGFCRLSIQDLDKKSNKIFSNERFCLLFNGEIYNTKSLIKKYFSNHNFKTNTDTEVLFNLILKFKFDKIKELEGIFSIAFIDIEEKIVTLIRDFTGTKPLYYTYKNNSIYFSSEAWFLYSLSKKEINMDSANFYFRYGFPPKKKTLVNDVLKIEPNTICSFYLRDKTIKTQKIIFNFQPDNYKNLSLKNEMRNAIKKNLIGNRNIGVFLSGGIDSSIISMITREYNPSVEAYTSVYEDDLSINEDYEVTKKFCKEYSIKLNTSLIKKKDMLDGDEFLKASNYFDEPIANLNFFSSFKQSQLAKENNAAVILTGDGADEIFGGYRKYQTLKIAKNLEFLSIFNKKLKMYKNLSLKGIPYHFSRKLSNKFYSSTFKKQFSEIIKKNTSHYYVVENVDDNISLLNHFDFNHWLVDEHNLKLDRATMANSVEGRVPFQDIKILQFLDTNNIKNKFTLLKNKIELRDAFKDLPNYILRRKKRGWFLPEQKFLNDFLKKNIFEIFSIKDYSSNDIFDYKKIYEIYFTQDINKFPRYEFITLLMFKIWHDKMSKC